MAKIKSKEEKMNRNMYMKTCINTNINYLNSNGNNTTTPRDGYDLFNKNERRTMPLAPGTRRELREHKFADIFADSNT